MSSGAFAHNYRFTKAELQVVKGKDVLKEYKDSNTKSGNTISRHFCSNCVCVPDAASALSFANEVADMVPGLSAVPHKFHHQRLRRSSGR
jgi:hypothetical protein